MSVQEYELVRRHLMGVGWQDLLLEYQPSVRRGEYHLSFARSFAIP